MKTHLPKRILALFPLLLGALAQPADFLDDRTIEGVLTRTNSVLTIAGPRDPVAWINQSYAAFTSSGIHSLLVFLAVTLMSFAAVNLAMQAATLGSLVPLRAQLLRFLFAVGLIALFSSPQSATSTGQYLIGLWGTAYSSVASSNYVREANADFLEAANRVYLKNAVYISGTGAFSIVNKLTQNKGFKLATKSNLLTRLLGGSLTELANLTDSILKTLKKAFIASSLAFTALVLIYSIFTTLSGFTWILGVLLLPLAAALYMFAPTQRVFGTVVSYMLSALFMIILLPLVLTLSIRVIILPDLDATSQLAEQSASYERVFQQLTDLQIREQREALDCLKSYRYSAQDGKNHFGALVMTPARTPVTIDGQTYYYLAFDPATNCSYSISSPTSPYTAKQQEEALASFFGDIAYTNVNPSLLERFTTTFTRYILGILKAATIGVLAFFLFVGMMRLIGQLLGAAGIGTSIENPIT